MDTVRLRCVKEGSRLRVRIVSPGYSPIANCQFPRDIRVDGREYEVPAGDIQLTEHHASRKFFYRVGKSNIRVVEPAVANTSLKVYGDPDACAICFDDENVDFVVFAPCGHCACCSNCGERVKSKGCPICRASIQRIVKKDELQQ